MHFVTALRASSLLIVTCALVLPPASASAAAGAPGARGDAGVAAGEIDCRADLDFVASFLLANDAGVRARGWAAYPEGAARRLAEQRRAAGDAKTAAACVPVLEHFFRAVRKGHLFATEATAGGMRQFDEKRAPRVQVRRLSGTTVYLGVPSFGYGIREQLEHIVRGDAAGIRRAKVLVIDLRRNDGGSDSSYQPLYDLLGPATYDVLHPDLLVTPGNIASWEAAARMVPASAATDRQKIAEMVARMRAAKAGAWIGLSTTRETSFRIDGARVKATPARVWIMTGPNCGSSCEQFLVAARQNPRVTLVGRPTFGSLDASNLRPVRTPSGAIDVFYATTYVRRPAGEEIDDVGIRPTVALPPPKDEAAFAAEVREVQRAAERAHAIPTRSP